MGTSPVLPSSPRLLLQPLSMVGAPSQVFCCGFSLQPGRYQQQGPLAGMAACWEVAPVTPLAFPLALSLCQGGAWQPLFSNQLFHGKRLFCPAASRDFTA